ncbi:hypothetical protein [Maribellus sediminis]|uniref:hypothetical protein n=1 Tax=Maribellus sediminis TaxID=2696285 RepID=UPI00142FA70E|nr:hypothetical protein [Maribellus sediminis]
MRVRILLFVAALGFAITSCEKIKDATAVDADVTLKVDIPLESTEEASLVGQKSAKVIYPFSGSATLDLATDEDVKEYVDGLRNIEASDVLMSVSGLTTDQVLTFVQVHVEVENTSHTATYMAMDVTVENSDNWVLTAFMDFVNSWDIQKNTVVKWTVNGTSNFKMEPDVVKIKVKIPSTISYSPL